MSVRFMRGATLIEATLALLLVSTGVLGMLGLLHQGLSLQRQQHWRLLAIELADELAERMQLNAANAVHYAQPWGTRLQHADIDCHARACTDVSWVQWDVSQWRQRIAQLPQGDVNVMPLHNQPDWWVVQVAWRDDREGYRPDIPDGHTAPCPAGMSCQPLFFQP